MPTDLPLFNEAELGHPELDEDKWGALENRFFDLLDSGQPLTISAEGKSYVLPPVNARRWLAENLLKPARSGRAPVRFSFAGSSRGPGQLNVRFTPKRRHR